MNDLGQIYKYKHKNGTRYFHYIVKKKTTFIINFD